MKYQSTPIDQSGLQQLLERFDEVATDGVLKVPDHEGQVVVKKGSPADEKCQQALQSNLSMFITEIQVNGTVYIQYIVSDDVLS